MSAEKGMTVEEYMRIEGLDLETTLNLNGEKIILKLGQWIRDSEESLGVARFADLVNGRFESLSTFETIIFVHEKPIVFTSQEHKDHLQNLKSPTVQGIAQLTHPSSFAMACEPNVAGGDPFGGRVIGCN